MSAICILELHIISAFSVCEMSCSAVMTIFMLLFGRLSSQLHAEQQPVVRVRSNGCDERSLTFREQQKLPLLNKPLRYAHGPESERFGLLRNEEFCGL